MVQTSLTSWLNRPKTGAPPIDTVSEDASASPTERQPEPDALSSSLPKASEEPQNNFQSDTHEAKAPALFVTRPLPENVRIQGITKDTLQLFKRLITLLLPVPYSDKFYTETISDPVANSVSRIAVWHEDAAAVSQALQGAKAPAVKPRVVAGIRCRILPTAPGRNRGDQDKPTLYIATIATLAPNRSLGIASTLLSLVTTEALEAYDVGSVTAHVWEANEEALDWYTKLGFGKISFDPEYYTRITPTGAWLLQRELGHDATSFDRNG